MRRAANPPHLAPALLAAVLACSAPAASASEAGDPLLSLLQARGVVAAPASMPAPRDAAAELVLAAMNFLDIQYRFGGSDSGTGFDCSGFTRHVVETALGLTLPRRADEQARAPAVQAVRREQLQPGDLVFFNTLRRAFSHVGLYIGDGRFVHAPRTGAQVRVESMRTPYWATRFDGARRVAVAPQDATAAVPRPDLVGGAIFDGPVSPH